MSTLESSPHGEPAAAETPTRAAEGSATTSTVGRFRYDALADTWWWSAEMFALHGLPPEESGLTTSRILSLKHPDDRAEAEATLRLAMDAGAPFDQPHRIVTADGAVRHVISVGEGIVLDGRVVAVHGYMADVTDFHERHVQADAWEEASRLIEQRAVIERAKGALMVRYGLDADAAFDLLRSWSSTRNEKLRDVARHVVDGL